MNKEKRQIYRVMDANLNRAREGLRVVEEVTRFVNGNKTLSSQIKDLRHDILKASRKLPLPLDQVKSARDAEGDVGRNSNSASERNKKNAKELAMANLQRVQEALRVLEEFSKLLDKKASFQFKQLRFDSYQLETTLLKRLS